MLRSVMLVAVVVAAPQLALAASFNGLGIPDWAIATYASGVSAASPPLPLRFG